VSFVIEDVLVRNDPAGEGLPVLFDSPHSGAVYPADFRFVCPLPLLRQAEDTHVDALFASAPERGATLIAALFPRTYIDANRAADDIDPAILDGAWPGPLRPTDKSLLGMGLIRWMCRPGVPLYDGRLPVAEVAERIDRYYRPYHFQVASVLDEMVRRFGAVWHVNCHSMPSGALGLASRQPVPDFVVGDLGGVSAEPGFVAFVAERLRALGYTVALNDPYRGVELVSRYADPARGRHSIQLEINRRLYMNEETLERNATHAPLQRDIATLIGDICKYAAKRVSRLAAE
jgi:N-formylglutamate deformylase